MAEHDAVPGGPWSRLLLCLSVLVAMAAFFLVAPPARGSAGSVVQIRNGPRPGALEIRAATPVALAPDLLVERQRADGSFEPVRNLDLDSLHLTASCARPPGTCVRVDAAGLRPVPWSGMSCSAQCRQICDRNVRLHGRFRFVALSCDRRTRYEGAVFAL